ncbi:uncharacterized protein LOC132174380 [Corylus avellana]|uniref:uncharacterized protein LOC132174380 n=1 Tax=Corylus avellana TaxID=13451 RepID=UPI00286AA21E|nr:uncharacterized protein LOC132174380 [Corylus avellana]
MEKSNTILDFFKRKNAQTSNAQTSNVNIGDTSSPTSGISISENSSKRLRRVDGNEFDISSLEFDPGLRRVAFRGRDESVSSTNRGNFLEILGLTISYNKQLAEAIAKAPKNATYTSPTVEKQILHVFSTKVKEIIRNEIGDAKFCVIVDEAHDESLKEQMAIVLRFVDKNGFVRERFFGLVYVSDIAALTLKKGIYSVLSKHQLDIQNIRGQGYDGASNMRGGWNRLQALVSNDCPYAYYIHCFAHCLQLALVVASNEVISVNQFFTKLNVVVNFVCASCNRYEELRVAQAAENAYMIAIDEIESGRGLNQISTLQRPGDARWSSHLRSVSNLIKIYSPACEVIVKIIDVGTSSSQRAEADSVHQEVELMRRKFRELKVEFTRKRFKSMENQACAVIC